VTRLRRHCPKCGVRQYAVLDTDGDGGVVEVVEPCACEMAPAAAAPKRTPAWRASIDNARRVAGVCQLCDEAVAGQKKISLYCPPDRDAQRAASMERYRATPRAKEIYHRWVDRNRKRLRKHARNFYQKSVRRRRACNDYKRQWRKDNPDKVKNQKRRYAIRHSDRVAAKQQKLRDERKAGLRVLTQHPRNERGERVCLGGCESVLTGRPKLCAPCKEAARGAVLLTREAA